MESEIRDMTRAERKAYKQGKRDGYDIGYLQGLYDGNPFNRIVDSLNKCVQSLADAFKDNPDLIEQAIKEAENESNNHNSNNMSDVGDDMLD